MGVQCGEIINIGNFFSQLEHKYYTNDNVPPPKEKKISAWAQFVECHGKTIQIQELHYRFIYKSFIPKANRTVVQRSLFPQFLEGPRKRQAKQTMKGVVREYAWDAPSLATAQ